MAPSPKLEQDFWRYRSTGDPEALARVFDATAPRLLLLAVHLTKDENRAEDLLQATFVRVIERAETYQEQRPFMPWVSAILTNEARMIWRAERSPEPDRVAERGVEDPADVAELHEAAAVLMAALDRLPDKYRTILRLKIVHGLQSVEIARTLNMPAATVRTRTSRGAELLCGMLPAGLATAVALLLQSRSLAAVKRQVMAKAGSKAVATGRLGLPWTFLAVGLVVLVGVVLWLGWNRTDPGDVPMGGRRVSVVINDSKPDATASVVNDLGRARSSRLTVYPAERWSVEGQVYDGAGRKVPAARVRARLTLGSETRELGCCDCDDDGRYQINLDTLRTLPVLLRRVSTSLWLTATARGHFPAVDQFLDPLPSADQPVRLRQDFVMTPAAALRGLVTDADGQPQGNAGVRLVAMNSGQILGEAHTDRDGSFAMPHPRSGACILWAFAPRAGTACRTLGVLHGDRDIQVPPLVVEAGAVLRGRLCVRDGPLPHYNLTAVRLVADEPVATEQRRKFPGRRSGRTLAPNSWIGRTDAAGRFRWAGAEPGEYRITVRDRFGTAQHFRMQTDQPATTLRVKGQHLALRLSDRESGRAIAGPVLFYQGWPASRQADRKPCFEGLDEVNFVPGQFHLLLPAGSRWRFEVAHLCCEPVVLDHVAEGVGKVLAVPLGPALQTGTLQLHLREENGARLGDFVLNLVRVDRPWQQFEIHSHLLRDGRTPPLAAGVYEMRIGEVDLFVAAAPLLRNLRKVRVRSDQVTEVHQVLRRGGCLSFRLTGCRSDCWRGLRVDAVASDGSSTPLWPRWYRASATGAIKFGNELPKDAVLHSFVPLPTGRYRLRLQSDGHGLVERDVQMQVGHRQLVKVRMPPAAGASAK